MFGLFLSEVIWKGASALIASRTEVDEDETSDENNEKSEDEKPILQVSPSVVDDYIKRHLDVL